MSFELLNDKLLHERKRFNLRPFESTHSLAYTSLRVCLQGVIDAPYAVLTYLIRDRVRASTQCSCDRPQRVALLQQDTDLKTLYSTQILFVFHARNSTECPNSIRNAGDAPKDAEVMALSR